jgi:ATP-dependent exoDNAse (exonuclease V) alpha subunit
MAIYRLEAKIISRQGGRSVIASAAYRSGNVLHSAAYRSGNQLTDKQTRNVFNYRARAQEVVHSEIMCPANGPFWLQTHIAKGAVDYHRQQATRQRLWNTIEQVEKRKDSQLARDFILTLARELSLEQQIDLVRGWCDAEFVSKGFVVDFAVHKSKTGLNPHAHVLVTTRPVEGQGFGKKPSTAGKFNGRGVVGLKGKSELEGWRDSWEKHENAALEKAGRPERVDHRSLRDRGIDREPEPKIGPTATAMQRRGLDPERMKFWRYIRTLNVMKPLARAIEKFGEIKQTGLGRTWWERTLLFMDNAREAGASVLERLRAIARAQTRDVEHVPERERGRDFER